MRLPGLASSAPAAASSPGGGGRRRGYRETPQGSSRRAAQAPGAGADPREGAGPAQEGAGEVSEAPDFVEPLEAWRVWKVVRRDGVYSLGSVIQRTVWPASEALVAECLAGGRLSFRLRRRK